MPWTAPFSDGVDVLFLIAFAEAVLFGDPPAPMPLPDGLTASWGKVLCTLDIRLLPALVVGLNTELALPSLVIFPLLEGRWTYGCCRHWWLLLTCSKSWQRPRSRNGLERKEQC